LTPRALSIRIAAGTALPVSLALALEPPQPDPRLPRALAAVVGILAGSVLFVAASRCRPSLQRRAATKSVLVGRQLFLALWAANEELLWRRVLLGELLVAGPLAALALSSAGFGLAHRRARLLHVGTGSAFGGLYLATGFLGASIAAHWTYNTLVGGLLERGPP
jgi:membrane protease YdiL (CAAX protease family)